MRLREPVRDAEVATDRLRALELIARLVEAAEAGVQIRAAEERIRLDRREPTLARPRELLVQERERLVDRRPAEEHRAADLVPGVDLAARVAGGDRVTRPCSSASSCAPRSRAASSAMPMICQASARSASLPIGSKTAIARRATARAAAGSVGPRMKARRARSISARSSVGSSPMLSRVLDRLDEGLLCRVERARASTCASQVSEQRGALGGLDCEQPARPLQERRRRPVLVAIERAPSGPPEQPPAFQRDGAGIGIDAAELRAEKVRLLEVIPDDLLVARHRRAGMPFEPRGKARMEIRTDLLRHGCIRDVADENVVEPEAVVPLVERAVRAEQLLAREREEDAAQPGRAIVGQQLCDGGTVEQPTLDGRALEHRPLARLEPVDASPEERLDRRRHGLVCGVGVVSQHCEHLLDEQRVPLGRVDDAITKRRSDLPVVHEPLDQPLGLVVVERREGDETRTGPGRRPRRASIEDVGPCEAEEQDRSPAREAEDVFEQVEQRRLGPVNVVHRDDERSRGGQRLEETAKRPRGLLR